MYRNAFLVDSFYYKHTIDIQQYVKLPYVYVYFLLGHLFFCNNNCIVFQRKEKFINFQQQIYNPTRLRV